MVKLGWAVKTGEPMRHNARYEMNELPQDIILKYIEPSLKVQATPQPLRDDSNICESSTSMISAGSLNEIEIKLNKIRMDFIATLGEAETYKTILAEHPSLREALESNYIQSRDQSSSLMGQLCALEETVKVLERHR